jgi:sortase A
MKRIILIAAGTVAVLVATASGSRSLWIGGKAIVAQHLLESAWQQTQHSGTQKKPWPWADVMTAARLHVPSINASLVVLGDASGEAMAFGPGLVAGNPDNAAKETIAVGGHRDTHLAFMEHLDIGSMLFLESHDGNTYPYVLKDKKIVDSLTHTLSISTQRAGLVLITCYPFSASQFGGPLRLVATALPLGSNTNHESSKELAEPLVGIVPHGIGTGDDIEPAAENLMI